MKVIILSVTPYKEKDGIVNGLSEDGFISFLARSIFNPTSKNAFLNCPLLVIDATFSEKNYKYKYLKSALQLINPRKIDSDYYYLINLMLLAESSKTIIHDEDAIKVFPLLLEAITGLKNKQNYWSISLIYLAKLVQLSGYAPHVNGCVKCGSKNNIVAFSFEEGGFLCANHVDARVISDLNSHQLLMLRQAFLNSNFRQDIEITKEDALVIFKKFFLFFIDNLGIKLTSAKLLNK